MQQTQSIVYAVFFLEKYKRVTHIPVALAYCVTLYYLVQIGITTLGNLHSI